jgi:hypothetical protein
MRGELEFVHLLRQHGKTEATTPLAAFARIANLPDEADEHVVAEAVLRSGPEVARAFWRVLQDLPAAVNDPTVASFVIGHDPLVPRRQVDLDRWDQWLDRLYQLSMEREPAKPRDGSSIKYREAFVRLVYDELSAFLSPRIRFWLIQSGAKEDLSYIELRQTQRKMITTRVA